MEDVKELIWFSAKEVLPKEGVQVLVQLYNKDYDICCYIEDESYGFDWIGNVLSYKTYDIKKWAYIPEPMEDKA